MFTTNHFIWLGICTLFIGGMLFASIKFKFSFKTSTYIMAAIAVASELCKIFTHIEKIYDKNNNLVGGVLSAGSLPLHLCSLLIFFILALTVCKSEVLLKSLRAL